MAASRNNQPLSKEEQEEEEMRHELSTAGLYEENMGIDDMRQLMQVVNESKRDSSMFMNVDADTAPSPTNPGKSQSTPEAARAVLERPLPSFSYRSALLTGGSMVQGPAHDHLRKKDEGSESAFDPFEIKANSQTDGPSTSNETGHGKDSNLQMDEYPALNCRSAGSRSSVASDGPRVLRSHDSKKRTAAMIKKSNSERWRMNPFEFVIDKRPEDSEKPIPKLSLENWNEEFLESEKFQEMFEQVSKNLDKLHEQFIGGEVARNMQKSQWGSPIKVATKSGWNYSLDKNPHAGKLAADEPAAGRAGPSGVGAGPSVSTRSERATKRKAMHTMAAVINDDSSHEKSKSDDSDDDFIDKKKRKKTQQAKKSEEGAKRAKEAAKSKAAADNDFETIFVDCGNQASDTEIFDNTDLHSLRKSTGNNGNGNSKKSNNNGIPEDSKLVDDKPQYPIRVTPPNPAKKSYKGPRAREKGKKPAQSDNNDAVKKSLEVSDNEISKVLNSIDKHIDEDNDCVEITNEINKSPATIKPQMQRKIQAAQSLLNNAHELEQQQQQQRNKSDEESKRKQEEEAQMKNDVVKKRLKAIMDEEKKKEKDEQFELQGEIYSNLFPAPQTPPQQQQQPRSTRAKTKRITRKTPTQEEVNEELLLGGDDDEPMIMHTNIVEKRECPICQQQFPSDKIAEHASGCNSFSRDDDGIASLDNYLTCNICNNFSGTGINYEEHVVRCKQEADDKRTGIFAS